MENLAEERVLSTLNADGTRRWLKPHPARGRFWRRRLAVAWALIGLFTLLPYLRINGKPPILLDIPAREFTLFGATFYPTDTLLLAFMVLSFFVGIFLLTALLGRVWCGWACPQTVYMEFLYRPIERFFEGEPGRRKKQGGWRTPAKHLAFLLVSMFLAHTFLAYFVGTDRLARWVTQSPLDHPVPFLVMLIVTALMLFDFGLFREQTCIVACPYGRFQSVMLDRESLIIGYDEERGEPRGHLSRKNPHQSKGDCIDCSKCVTCCPTGIDIRDGLQLECIGCAQCIDACDDVMERIGRPRGLIRYSSQSALMGAKPKLFRPRAFIYPILLAVFVTGFVLTLLSKQPADVWLLRGRGAPYSKLPDGDIANQVKLKLHNRTNQPATYQAVLISPDSGRLISDNLPVTLEPLQMIEIPVAVVVPPGAFSSGDPVGVVRVTGPDGFEKSVRQKLFGPRRAARNNDDEHHHEDNDDQPHDSH